MKIILTEFLFCLFLDANNNWIEQDTKQAQVVALYDYVARNSDELSFTKGTTIYLAPLGKKMIIFPFLLNTSIE